MWVTLDCFFLCTISCLISIIALVSQGSCHVIMSVISLLEILLQHEEAFILWHRRSGTSDANMHSRDSGIKSCGSEYYLCTL